MPSAIAFPSVSFLLKKDITQGPDPPRKDAFAPNPMAIFSASLRCGTRCVLAGSKTASWADLPMSSMSPTVMAYAIQDALPTWNTRSFTGTF